MGHFLFCTLDLLYQDIELWVKMYDFISSREDIRMEI